MTVSKISGRMARCFFETGIYFALKNLVLWSRSEFSGSALEFGV
jgi:hypothetical protein